MKKINTLLITLIGLQLLACGPDKTPPPKLFEEQRTVLDKAVEDTVQQQNQNMQQNLEKQSQ
jgi:hypothetical protein